MGWLDKTLKNVARGARDFAKGPGGIMLLGAAAPYLAAGLGGTGAMAGLKGAMNPTLLKTLSSPWIKNALTNAAIQGGIATITRSKHPWKAMTSAALTSLPFTALQSVQAANAFNKAQGLTGDDAAKWYDFALGNDITKPRDFEGLPFKDLDLGEPDMIQIPETQLDTELGTDIIMKDVPTYQPGSHHYAAKVIPAETFSAVDAPGIDMSYFTNPGQAAMASENPGILGLGALAGDLDLMAAVVPQIAGMYGGRMTDEERWEAAKEKQIRMWAFQFGIPYDEAKEIFKDGYRNPYYQTQTPSDYGDIMFANRGGHIYKDDYTAGGKAVGPGGPKDDAIRPVALSDDEFVFTAEASNNFPGGHAGLYALMNSLDPESERPEEARERIV
jgi:hypothetical protein